MGQAIGRGAPPLSDNLRGAGFMMIAMAAFTLGDACMKSVAAQMPLYQAVTLRGMVTLPLLALIGHLTGGLDFRGTYRARRMISWRVVGEVGSTLTFFVALVNMPLAALSAILQSLPLAVTAAAALFLGEKVGWRRMVAICTGFVGVLIIVRPGPDGLNIYALVALVSVAFVVLRDLATRQLPAAVPSTTVALFSALSVTVVGAGLSLREPWTAVPVQAMWLIPLAGACVVTGYIFIIRVMRVGEVGFTTPFRYTSLVWAMILGWVFFREWPDLLTLLGAAIVVASGVFTLVREARLRRAARI
jgi:drug/metabolite transporter (DMT)-like permease